MSNLNFLEVTKNLPPSKLLMEAVDFVKEKGQALDLGSGAFRDSYFLAEQGFVVDAVDKSENAPTYLKDEPRIAFYNVSFCNFVFTKNTYDLINAQYSLPFNPPDSFHEVFDKITKSLKLGGIFVGQFFGDSDEWSNNKKMSFYSKEEVLEFFEPYNIHVFREKKEKGKLASGDAKFWHVFNIIAERK